MSAWSLRACAAQYFVFLWMALSPVMAMTKEYAEERIEVLGLRLRQPGIGHDPVTVIDRSRIEQLGAWSGPEILRYVPGLDVVRSGGLAGQTSLFLRGGNSKHTLVLIDGVRVNDPISGVADLAMLPTAEIGHIEVVRGPQGVAYGADAMGGVVRIYTRGKRRRGLHAEADVAGGSYRSQRQVTRVTTVGTAATLDLTLSRGRAAGFSIANPAPQTSAEADGYRAAAANMHLRYMPASGVSWDLGLRHQSNRQDIEGFTSVLVDDPDYRQWDRSSQGYALVSSAFRPGWNQQLRVGFYRLHRIAENGPLASTCCSSNLRGTHAELEWTHDWQDWMSLGLNVRREQVMDRHSSFRRSLDRGSVWLETLLGPVRAGLRHEQHDAYGGHLVWRVGLYGPAKGPWSLRAQLGTARRTPGITELYGAFGNPNLRPERSLGLDLGATYQTAVGRVELSLYHQRYRELLGFGSDFRPLNTGRAFSRGVELSLAGNAWRLLDLHVDYTYTQTRDQLTGKSLARRPRHKFSATATASRRELGIDASLSLRHVGTRLDTDFSDRVLPSYTVADAVCRWQVLPGIQTRFRVENLSGRNYQEAVGYSAPGRTFYVGIRYAPKGDG